MSAALPLDGVKVLDLSTVFMGPYAAGILGDWGAEVIKIEAFGGDQMRGVGDVTRSGLGPIYINANRGKRSIALDLKAEGAREVFEALVAQTDILIHNVRPPAAVRLGITWEQLAPVNPRLVHCAFRGYASGGPWADRPAYDDVIQAGSGIAMAEASAGGDPAYWRSAAADKIMGIYGAAAACAALRARDVTGEGRAVEIPMFESMAAFMLLDRQGGWVTDPPSGPTGYPRTDSPHRRPYATKDGHLAVMIYADKQWLSFFRLIGRPELCDDPRFSDINGRTRHIDELYSMLADEMLTRTTAEWQAAFEAADIPHGPVNSIEDLFEDPQLTATNFFQSVEQPGLGTVRLNRSPIDVGAPDPGPRPAPRLGEHTREILAELGLDSEVVSRLHDSGVVRSHD